MRLYESQKEIIDTLRNPAKHSATERKRAYLFLAVYFLGFIALACNLLHFVSGWIAVIVIQLCQLIIAIMYAFNINDYSDKQSSAMECERVCNPLVDAYIAIRVIQIVHVLWLGSWMTTIFLLTALGICLWRRQKGSLYVDAANLWREVKKSEVEGYVMCAVDVVMIVCVMLLMIFSLIKKYS